MAADSNKKRKHDESPSSDTEEPGSKELDEDIVIETKTVPDGGWGWMVVLGCAFLRMIGGGIGRSSGLFYVKFLERFGGTATETAWVTSLSGTVRLLTGIVPLLETENVSVVKSNNGPFVSVLCNRYSARNLSYIGCCIFVIAIHISAYSTSLTYLYISYGVLGGLGKSFLLTPCTILLGEYFDKRRSLAFGLASAGFGIGGFTITPIIATLFENYGFSGTFILLSGIACHVFIAVSLFRQVEKRTQQNEAKKREQTISLSELGENDADETVILLSEVSSTGSVHMTIVDRNPNGADMDMSTATLPENSKKKRASIISQTYKRVKQSLKSNKDNNDAEGSKNKLISFSILKDIRFLTLCMATFVFSLPTSGMFLPALAKARGISEIQAAYLLSIIAGCDTASRVISGFVLDMKPVRHLRPFIYNGVSFVECLVLLCFPQLSTFGQFAAVCCAHGAVMGMKVSQRSVILVDILGAEQLPSSFAILLAVQGIATLIGPPVSGLLKDTYGKYDYTFYFGACAVFVGALTLVGGNMRNHCEQKKTKTNKDVNDTET